MGKVLAMQAGESEEQEFTHVKGQIWWHVFVNSALERILGAGSLACQPSLMSSRVVRSFLKGFKTREVPEEGHPKLSPDLYTHTITNYNGNNSVVSNPTHLY